MPRTVAPELDRSCLTWKLYKILFDSQRFASCNIYYLKTYASTECLKQTSTLQTFADEISCCLIFFDVWELFCVSTRHQKLKIQKSETTLFLLQYIQPATLRTPSKNPLLRFLSAQKTFFCCFYMKEHL